MPLESTCDQKRKDLLRAPETQVDHEEQHRRAKIIISDWNQPITNMLLMYWSHGHHMHVGQMLLNFLVRIGFLIVFATTLSAKSSLPLA
jgi:hypothetical protein